MIRRSNLEAAGAGYRWAGAMGLPGALASAHAGAGIVRNRARAACFNNGYAQQGVHALASSFIGTGIRPKSAHPDPAEQDRIDAPFGDYAEACNLHALSAQVAAGMVRDGEALVYLGTDPDGRLDLRLLDPDQIDANMHRDLPSGGRIVAGVEVDAAGRVLAYHVFDDMPGLGLRMSMTPRRIDAADIAHVFRPDLPGQVRGLSWFAPALLRLGTHDATEDAILMQLRTSSLLSGFVTDASGGAGGFAGTLLDGVLDGGMEPGTLKILPHGSDVRFSQPTGASASATDFLTTQLRGVAAALGLPFHLLTGDLTGANYSSLRAGSQDFRRRVKMVQEGILIPRLMRPIWRRWLTLEILSGRIAAPGFESEPETWLRADFLLPGFEYTDPAKEIAAEILAIDAGLKSRAEVVAGRGRDLEALDREIAADTRRPTPTPRPAPAAQPRDPEDDDTEDQATEAAS